MTMNCKTNYVSNTAALEILWVLSIATAFTGSWNTEIPKCIPWRLKLGTKLYIYITYTVYSVCITFYSYFNYITMPVTENSK